MDDGDDSLSIPLMTTDAGNQKTKQSRRNFVYTYLTNIVTGDQGKMISACCVGCGDKIAMHQGTSTARKHLKRHHNIVDLRFEQEKQKQLDETSKGMLEEKFLLSCFFF